jgi:N-acetylglutamate synthase-like GNAT family acetyltransferase
MTTGIAGTTGLPGAAGAAALGLRLREARPSDADALAAMFERCSTETRVGRFHGMLHALPAAYLIEALTASDSVHDALVLQDPAGELVALASARRLDGEPAVEVGLLIEDTWQRRALGPLLLTSLAVRARGRGVLVLRCDVLASRQHLVEVVRRTLGPIAVRREGFEVHVEVRLR